MGFGHVARVEAILDAWSEAGGRAVLLGRGVTGSFASRMSANGVEVRDLTPAAAPFSGPPEAVPPARDDDLRDTLTCLREVDAYAVLTDGYAFDRAYLTQLARETTLVSIDDLAAFPHPARVVVNSAVDFPVERYEVAEQTRLLVGSEYIPLRREIRSAIAAVGAEPAGDARIVVTLGAADFGELTRPVTERLLRHLAPDWRVKVVCGPAMSATERDALGEMAERDPRVELCVDVRAMAELVAGARFVISAAGSTTWELLALGLPVVGFAVAENQRPIAEATARRGAVAVPGYRPTAEAVVDLSVDVLQDPARQSELARRGRDLVDGKGVWRIIEAIAEAVAATTG